MVWGFVKVRGGGGGQGGRTFQKLRNLEVEILLDRGITLKRGG